MIYFSEQSCIFHVLPDFSHLVLGDTLLRLTRQQSDPLLQTGSLHLQSLHGLSQGPQAGPQVHGLFPALPQERLPNLPSLQQGREPRLVPALQGLHTAAEPPLQSHRSLPALAHVTHGPGPAGPRDLVPQGVLLVLLELGQLLGQTLDVGLELLLWMDVKFV